MATLIFQSKLRPTSVQSQIEEFLLSKQDYELIIYYRSQDLMKNDPPKIELWPQQNALSIRWIPSMIN